MYSLSDIVSCSVKNETPERSSCNEQSSETLSLNDALEYSMESGQLKNLPPRARSELDQYQSGPSSLTTTHLVSLQEEIRSQEDFLKFQKRKIQETTYNKKWFKYDLAHRKRENSTSSTCSTATLISRTSAYPVDFSGEITSQDGIQMNNTMSTYKKAALPLKSANPLPSRDDIYAKVDNQPIQITKVYENPYNEKAVKGFIDDLTTKYYSFPLINGRNQTSADSTLEGISSPKLLCKNQPIKDNGAYYPKEKDAKSFTNGSVDWNTVHFTKTTAPQRDFSRSPMGCKPPNFQTTLSPYQRRDQNPENTGSTTLSAYKSDARWADYLHNSSLEIIPCYHIYNIRLPSPNDENSNFTIPPQHIRVMEEITAQEPDVAKNLDVYQPESSLLNQKGIQLSHNAAFSGISTNLDKSASSSKSWRQEQPQRQAAFDLHPVPSLGNRRPSVIMVPASWSSIYSRESHVPLKVDDVPATSQSLCQMGNVVDLDSSDEDDDEENEKYLRVNIDGKTATFKLTKEDWTRIPISTFPSGGRLLSGDWRKIFVNKVKESNPWCSLRFKNNHVRSENSRKLYSAVFFRGAAECKRPECNVKVRFVIQKERGKYVEVTYVGNVCHSSQPGGGGVVNHRIRRKQNN